MALVVASRSDSMNADRSYETLTFLLLEYLLGLVFLLFDLWQAAHVEQLCIHGWIAKFPSETIVSFLCAIAPINMFEPVPEGIYLYVCYCRIL